MSLALETGGSGTQRPGFVAGIAPCVSSAFEFSDSGQKIARGLPGEGRFLAVGSLARKDEEGECGTDSSCSSSIGRNSDLSGGSLGSVDDEEEGEVQSSYKGPLDTMDALEDSLPIRRGVSKFYSGKSKSFTNLADISSSAKDLAKTEDPYNRKRKNLLAFHIMFDRNQNCPLRHNLSKRPANSSRNQIGFASSRSSSSESSTSEECQLGRLPPLHPQGKSFAARSFSLMDLHCPRSNPSLSSKEKDLCAEYVRPILENGIRDR